MRSFMPRSPVDHAWTPAARRLAAMLPAVVLALVLIVPGAPHRAQAQEPEETGSMFSGSISVDVTNIEVFVTNSRGVPVTGLDADDLEVLVDGEPVEITNFFEVHDGEVSFEPPATPGPAGPEPAVEPTTRLSLVVYVDLVFSRSRMLSTTLGELSTFLAKSLGEDDRVMVVAFTGGIQVLTPLSTDHRAAIDAVDSLRHRAAHGDLLDAAVSEAIDIGSTAPGGGVTREMLDQMAQDKIASLAEERRLLTRKAMRSLQATVATLAAGSPGRKALLMVSDGTPANPLQGPSEAYTTGIIGPNRSIRSTPRGLLDIVALANASGVTFYTVAAGGITNANPTGVITPDVPGRHAYGSRTDQLRRNAFALDSDTSNSLGVLAADTGGVSVRRASPRTLKAIANDLGSYYSIGFRPSSSGGEVHGIEVRVKGRKLDVRHRRWYQALEQRDMLVGRTLAALEVPTQDNSIDLSCEPGDARREGTQLMLPLTLRFPVARIGMVPSGEEWVGQLRLFLVARQAGGDLSPIKELTLPLRLSQAAFADENLRRFALSAELPVRSGEVIVAVTAYDEVAKTASTITTELELGRSGRLIGGQPTRGITVHPPEPLQPSGAGSPPGGQ